MHSIIGTWWVLVVDIFGYKKLKLNELLVGKIDWSKYDWKDKTYKKRVAWDVNERESWTLHLSKVAKGMRSVEKYRLCQELIKWLSVASYGKGITNLTLNFPSAENGYIGSLWMNFMLGKTANEYGIRLWVFWKKID